MGMQAHFSIRDLPENAKVQIVETMPADEEYPFALYDAVIIIPGNDIESFNYNQNTESCWFDVGSCSDPTINLIKWLIRNRIVFCCA